jgi:WD40 repeat protein
MVATCSADKFVKLWKVPELTLVREFLAHDNGTYGLAWSPDGGMLVTAGADKTVRFWDPATGQELRSVDFPESVAVNTVVFDPDGGHVYIGDDSGEVLMIDVAAGAIVERGKAQASVKSLALID